MFSAMVWHDEVRYPATASRTPTCRRAGHNAAVVRNCSASWNSFMRTINVLATTQRISADDRVKIEASDPAIRLIDAGGWFDGETRETWAARRGRSDHRRLTVSSRSTRQGTAAKMASSTPSRGQQPARQRSVGQRYCRRRITGCAKPRILAISPATSSDREAVGNACQPQAADSARDPSVAIRAHPYLGKVRNDGSTSGAVLWSCR
jgi:hypothetical protein